MTRALVPEAMTGVSGLSRGAGPSRGDVPSREGPAWLRAALSGLALPGLARRGLARGALAGRRATSAGARSGASPVPAGAPTPGVGAQAPRATRCDMHAHSNASSGPATAALGMIGCPECYTEPERAYEQAMARGMDLFALTDHDTIRGAMSLVERGFPNVIVGQEVTVYFPEDRCKLHVLVWDLSPAQDEEITRLGLRDDVYEFARWLHANNLPHALAHPLYVQNAKLTRWHLERCALLFKNFEVVNGAHSGTHVAALERFLASLTPGRVHRLVQQHGLEPLWPRVWEKGRTGGSDDHGLLNIGRSWTSVTPAQADGHTPGEEPASVPARTLTAREFVRAVGAGRCDAGGEPGHAVLLAHQLATVGAHYYARRVAPRTSPRGRYIASHLLRFAGVDMPPPSRAALALDVLKRRLARRRREAPIVEALKVVLPEVMRRYPDLEALAQGRAPGGRSAGSALSEHERTACFVDELHTGLHRAMAAGLRSRRKGLGGLTGGGRDDVLDTLVSYLALELSQVPYLFSLFHQNKERSFVEQIEREAERSARALAAQSGSPSPARGGAERGAMRVLLFTDTLGDVNGVSRFIRNTAEQARRTGRDLRVLTSTRFEVPAAENIVNFEPVLAGQMPGYSTLEAVLPPVVRMLRYADAARPDVIHISTPGSVGAVGLLAAKMLRVPVLGVYHTDFPAYIEHLFSDPSFTWTCERWMKFFYAGFAGVFSRSKEYGEALGRIGVGSERLHTLQAGIDIDAFHPRFRDERVWERLPAAKGPGAGGGSGAAPLRVLYCGRVSVEKNLPLLTEIWRAAAPRLAAQGTPAELVVVGDGPYRAEMERELAGTPARFLGFRHGVELSTIYASSDAFVFPSLTDTLGQVVMESQSSGLPVLVSDQGGPKEVVRHNETGMVLPGSFAGAWVEAIVALARDGERRGRMGRAAHESMLSRSFRHSFEDFWRVHEETLEAQRARGRAAYENFGPAGAAAANGAAAGGAAAGGAAAGGAPANGAAHAPVVSVRREHAGRTHPEQDRDPDLAGV